MNKTFLPADILIPSREKCDLSAWSVVACDQYTSEPKYWEDAEKLVGDKPSALRVTFPEIYLERSGKAERISAINASMEEYLSSRKEKIAGISAAYGCKPIVFTELGVRSAHGCVMQPGNYQWETSYDGQEQADYMEACMNTFWQLPCWMGLFWWKWDETQYRPHYHDEPGVDKGFTVRGKPAERVMADWFRKLNAGR